MMNVSCDYEAAFSRLMAKALRPSLYLVIVRCSCDDLIVSAHAKFHEAQEAALALKFGDVVEAADAVGYLSDSEAIGVEIITISQGSPSAATHIAGVEGTRWGDGSLSVQDVIGD